MTKETTTPADLVDPQLLLRLSPPPSASAPSPSPSAAVMTPSSACDIASRLADEQNESSPIDATITSSLVEVENTPPPALSPRDTSYHSYPHHHHNHHLHHHHHHLPQRLSPQNWTLESNRTEDDDGVVVVLNHSLPLSPSMTPPIVLSPAVTEDEEVPSTQTTTSSDSVANSPLSLASEDEEEEEEEEVEKEADVGVEGTMPSEDHSTSSVSHSPVQQQQQQTTPEKSPSPRLTRSSRPGSLRNARSSARFKPYRTGTTTTKNTTTSVLRPLNDDKLCQRPSTISTSSSCDTTATRTTDDAVDADDVPSLESTTHSSNTDSSSTSGHLHQQLTIDTALANSQSAAAHQQSRAAKLALVQKLINVIDDDDFERFRTILRQSKQPDLNVFVNGQTALHYALLRGRDVSWCKQLVLFGANPNLSNLDGWHPLHLASFSGLNENLTYLISCNTNNGQQVK